MSDNIYYIDKYNVNGSLVLASSQEDQKDKERKASPNFVQNNVKGELDCVYPFKPSDINNVIEYFISKKQWHQYLAFVLEMNLARRIGDILKLEWKDVLNPKTGEFREKVGGIIEQKTGKTAAPYINNQVKNATKLFIENTGVNPDVVGYNQLIFMQYTGRGKGHPIQKDTCRKAIKEAAKSCGIEYNVGTHSARKTFGMINFKSRPNDPYAIAVLQQIFNHSDPSVTRRYIGITEEMVKDFYSCMDRFFEEYKDGVLSPTGENIVHIDYNDLRNLVASAYNKGVSNAGLDTAAHVDAVSEIFGQLNEHLK